MSDFALNILFKTHSSIQKGKFMCIYSPCDKQRFHPLDKAKRTELRNAQLPKWLPNDAIVLGWVGVNSWRKQVWVIYKLIKYIRTGGYYVCRACSDITLMEWDSMEQKYTVPIRNPASNCCRHCGEACVERAAGMSNVFLWSHMAPDDPFSAWPIKALERTYGVEEGRDIIYTEGHGLLSGLDPNDMPTLYHTFDMLLFLSGGEGFGIPVWEAMSSGVPVVYTNYSSHAELVSRANGGLPVEGVLQPQGGDCVLRMIADMEQAISAVRRLISDPVLRDQLGRNGADFTARFNVKEQVQCWHDLFLGVLAEESGTDVSEDSCSH